MRPKNLDIRFTDSIKSFKILKFLMIDYRLILNDCLKLDLVEI